MIFKRILVLLFFITFFVSAKSEIIIYPQTTRVLIGKNLKISNSKEEDPLRVIFNKETSSQDVPNLGLVRENVWIKFTVFNKSDESKLLLELAYPLLDVVTLYEITEKFIIRNSLSERNNFGERKYNYPTYIFDLNIPKGTEKTYYLQIKSSEQIIIPIYINKPDSLWSHLSSESALNGIYLGIVLIMFLYNLFVYFSVKDRSYLYYVIYLIFVGLTQLSIKGYTFQYLWPNQPAFTSISSIVFASLSGIGAILVTKSFLQTKINTPKFDVFLKLQILVFVISLISCLIDTRTGFQIMQVGTSITTLSILVISCMLMIQGYTPAIFFFSAWSILVAGAVVFLLKDYNLVQYNIFTSYSMQAASAIEMALLSFGLADRINILKKEKEASQAEALASAQENERIIKEQNVILEQKVTERTHELIETNEELSDTLENLKQTQTQLVAAEKMASLGQLTAGIAHEINNPINFVTSNVSPLTRDVNLLLEAIDNIESIGLSEKSKSDKQQEIEDYKEDLDFDYLKIEINHLLKGIHDGASRTAEIVKGLRVFSRLDEDDLKKADINEGLDSTLIIMNNALSSGKIKVIKEYGNIPTAECYPGKLNQVFLNIISNAIHAVTKVHGESGEGELKISTESREENIYVTIKDNGSGMDDVTKGKIFDPFFTTKDVGEGTGLGMSIAYNTIKNHHGEILINSEIGKGTEMIIQIPIIYKIILV
ncbi:sensor histidine kinase [Pedobacter arcticus]|uniref:sensor histidine kinase n=1 Tax=Pedobacter arcticus TaxID=752140 RepID=UPI00058BBDBB|nr:7TM diverse intracellular signaling domain-containing protein [Pedobacter arcticus]